MNPVAAPLPRSVTAAALVLAAVLATFAVALVSAADADASSRRKPAPKVRVEGHTLHWKRVSGIKRYRVRATAPGMRKRLRRVRGRSYTPAAAPGMRVRYRVAAASRRARWSRPVSITYAPSAANPTPAAPPAAVPNAALPRSFEGGVSAGTDTAYDPAAVAKLGAKVVRVEFGVGASPVELQPLIEMYWRAGARVLPLAGFHASMATPDEARNLALWARTYGRGGSFWVGKPNPTPVSEIEFGNETSFTYQYGDAPGSNSYRSRAETYALRFKDAQAAIAAANPNVGLLAQADDGGTGSSEWVDRMFAAVPDLASRVAGWTVHPYGPAGRAADRLTRTVASTTAHGAPTALPLWITENGFATDNGRCLSDNYGWDRCMSYDQAGANLTSLVQTLRGRFPQIRAFLLYQARDQRDPGATGEREHYFGALTRTDGDKGGYTGAVRQLMAAH